MSYVAIARKWRPTTFDEIVGQKHVTKTLTNAIAQGRVHHAFLFTGARGVGKTTAARALSQALNCDKGPTATPCGECTSCNEVKGGQNPDVIEIDGASNNSVDDVRELRESVRYLPRGRNKIYIVDEAHMLSRPAWNALLKTLEEPPPHVVFIFATTEPQKIPDTIISRVQRFDFKRIPVTLLMGRLRAICDAEGVAIADDALRLVARAADGSMRDAQSLLDRVISFSGDDLTGESVAEILGLVDRELLYTMLEGMLKGHPARCLGVVEQVYDYGYELTEFTSEMLELLRNAALSVLSPDATRYIDVSDGERDRLSGLTKDTPPDVFVRSFQVMLDVHEELSRAPRPRLVLEMAVARLMTIKPARPVDQVVAQIADLERRLKSGGARSQRTPATAGDDDDDDSHPAAVPPPSPERPTSQKPPVNRSMDPPKPPQRPPPADRRPLRLTPPIPEPPEEQPEEQPGARQPVDTVSEQPEQVVPIDPDDEPVLEAGPPPIRADASSAERHEALCTWLHAGGISYDLWAEDSMVIDAAPPKLSLGFPTEFKRNQAQARLLDDRVKQGLAQYFPAYPAVTLSVRPADHPGQTRREAAISDYKEEVDQIRAELEQTPLVQRIQELFSAEIASARPDGRHPPFEELT